MTKVKLFIIALAMLGLVALFLPQGSGKASTFQYWLAASPRHLGVILATFGVPLVLAFAALVKPPLRAWQSVLIATGFVLAAVKVTVWERVPTYVDQPIAFKLIVAAAIVGALFALVGLIRPERHA